MTLIPLVAMIRKDLQLFFSDRRSVIVSFVVPIAIASFFGSIFSGGSQNRGEPARISVVAVDQDRSAISGNIVDALRGDAHLKVTTSEVETAREAVRRGDISIGVVIPQGFGAAAGEAFFGQAAKPSLDLLYDPSRNFELAMVRGLLAEHVMQAVSREMFGGAQGREYVDRMLPQIETSKMPADQKRLLLRLLQSVQKFYDQPADASSGGASRAPGLTMPYAVREEAMTSSSAAPYNGYAHSFGGMAIQFLLFAMANLGVEMLL